MGEENSSEANGGKGTDYHPTIPCQVISPPHTEL